MKRASHLTSLIGFVLLALVFGACKPGYAAETSTRGEAIAPVHAFTLNDIDGKPLALNTFRGESHALGEYRQYVRQYAAIRRLANVV